MTHPFHAAYEKYIEAKHRFFSYRGDDNEGSDRRYYEMAGAVNTLMATSLCRSGMRWALLVKLEILEHELANTAEAGDSVYPICLPWLGYIKADMISLAADRDCPSKLEAA